MTETIYERHEKLVARYAEVAAELERQQEKHANLLIKHRQLRAEFKRLLREQLLARRPRGLTEDQLFEAHGVTTKAGRRRSAERTTAA